MRLSNSIIFQKIEHFPAGPWAFSDEICTACVLCLFKATKPTFDSGHNQRPGKSELVTRNQIVMMVLKGAHRRRRHWLANRSNPYGPGHDPHRSRTCRTRAKLGFGRPLGGPRRRSRSRQLRLAPCRQPAFGQCPRGRTGDGLFPQAQPFFLNRMTTPILETET